MRRYVMIWLSVAATVFLGFLGLSEYMVRVYVEPHDLLTRHAAKMAASSTRNALFGDSHAALGFTGQTDVINLAFPGENTTTIASKARAYYRRVSLDLVMLQAGAHQFAPKRDNEVGRDYDDGRLQIGGIGVLSPWHRPQLPQYWQVLLKGGNFVANRNLQTDGAQTVTANFGKLSQAERMRDAKNTVLSQIPPRDMNQTRGFRNLQNLIEELMAGGARVCLVSFPVAKSYRDIAKGYPNFAAARKSIATLATRHEIPYADFWAALSDDRQFSNSDHLNDAGARRLAPMIIRACEKPVQATGSNRQ